MKEALLRIGVITQPHGIKGEVKVFPTTDSPGRFLEVKHVILRGKNKDLETEILGARFFKNMAIVHFSCFQNPEDAAKFRQADVMIRREDAQPLEEGEYYIADLLGCRVFADEKTEGSEDGFLGVVEDVLQTGANDVYVVKNGKKEILIPVIKDCIKRVDIEKGEILVHLLPGLI